ncbi:MAG: proline dehydrogenase family protein [Vicinamibacterales bacterium]
MSVMRKALLWASTNAWMRDRATRTGFVRRSVVKFMPGETIEDAITAARALPPGVTTIFTRLGENLAKIDDAKEVSDHYHRVIDLIAESGLDAQISVKPTQLGYDQDPDVCFNYCADLLEHVDRANNFFWLDMESSPYVDGTIALYRRLRERSPRVGIAIQAYLRRTAKDIEDLLPLGAAIRLVKGAYLEPPDVAFPEKKDVDENFFTLSCRLLDPEADKPGALLHIATHDIPLQERLQKVIADRHIPATRYSMAMLYGIQSGRQASARRRARAHPLPDRSTCEYWFPGMRRLAERPANVVRREEHVWGLITS